MRCVFTAVFLSSIVFLTVFTYLQNKVTLQTSYDFPRNVHGGAKTAVIHDILGAAKSYITEKKMHVSYN